MTFPPLTAQAAATFLPLTAPAAATFLPPTATTTATTAATTANLPDLETSSDSNLSSPPALDCLKANFNLVATHNDGNPTGTLGRPWAELNAKDESHPLAKNLGMFGRGKLTKKMLVLHVIKACNEKDICDDETLTALREDQGLLSLLSAQHTI